MKLALERQIQLAFIFALIVLITLAFFAYRSATALNESLHWEQHTQEVLMQLNGALNLITDVESNGRGFIITGNEGFLEPYKTVEQKIAPNLEALRGLVADNPKQTEELGRLENAVKEKIKFTNRLIDTRRNQGFEAAGNIIASLEGKRLMDEIQTSVGKMEREEKTLLRGRENDLNQSVRDTFFILFFGTTAGIVSLALANFAVFREVGMRRKIEDEIRIANKDLENRVAERTREISEREEFTRSIFENSPECVQIMEFDGTLRSINTNGLRLMEIDDYEPFVGSDWVDFWEDDENEMAYQAVETARKGKTARFEGFCRTAKGNPKWWEVSVAPIFDASGKTIRLIATSRDVTERRRAESEREELLRRERVARKDAEIANRLRDEFLATVSHELRAPLNSILGWGRLLEKGKLDETTSGKAVSTIVRNAEAQNRLIEDLLDVSRIISGKLRLEVMTVKPINVVESALETVRPAAEAKGIHLEIKEDADISHISGDPNRLQQVIWNLLSNAIKFTPSDGKVQLEIERDDNFVEIRVKDSGVGIKEEFLPHVFDRFTQADASSIRKFGGLGLGLAIVRHITEMHGGTVHATSEGENKGATFVVRLPLIAPPTEDEKIEGENKNRTFDGESPISLDGLLILVVDDEEDTRQLLVQSLTHYGATVTSASSAAEGLSALEDKNPDLLVSDIGMPDEDGYTLIRKVRALPNEKLSRVPAIALTAFTRAQDRMRALSSGFQSHVAKPVEPDELATVIASLTGRLNISAES